MGFRSLRVMNEDRVDPGQGFGMHPHRDMEIVTYVLEGELSHKDSMGNGSVIGVGDFQRMTAGTGIYHSEANPSVDKPVHLYQIWIKPNERGLEPSYEERRVVDAKSQNRLELVASNDGRGGSLTIHQDVDIYLGRLDANAKLNHEVEKNRYVWLQVLRGAVTLNGKPLGTSDGAAVEQEGLLEIAATEPAEIMLFDLK